LAAAIAARPGRKKKRKKKKKRKEGIDVTVVDGGGGHRNLTIDQEGFVAKAWCGRLGAMREMRRRGGVCTGRWRVLAGESEGERGEVCFDGRRSSVGSEILLFFFGRTRFWH